MSASQAWAKLFDHVDSFDQTVTVVGAVAGTSYALSRVTASAMTGISVGTNVISPAVATVIGITTCGYLIVGAGVGFVTAKAYKAVENYRYKNTLKKHARDAVKSADQGEKVVKEQAQNLQNAITNFELELITLDEFKAAILKAKTAFSDHGIVIEQRGSKSWFSLNPWREEAKA